jgi:hypothetical protein
MRWKSVSGHVTSSATYVQPHTATNPNSTQMDNYSTRGNVNPNTGVVGMSKLAWRSLLWRYPSLGHRTLNNVPLDPFAFWAGKRSQVLAQRARLNRRQPHWRTASRALWTLVLCVEHGWLPSVRSPEFPSKLPHVSRFHRVARNDFVPYGVALRTFEPATLKAHATRVNAPKHHA